MSDIFSNENPLTVVVCNNCKHYNRKDHKHFSCTAFKDIPKSILSGARHDKPLPDQDNNIVFELKK
jgi:hypothetical protein